MARRGEIARNDNSIEVLLRVLVMVIVIEMVEMIKLGSIIIKRL
jgi:hypothetical protein